MKYFFSPLLHYVRFSFRVRDFLFSPHEFSLWSTLVTLFSASYLGHIVSASYLVHSVQCVILGAQCSVRHSWGSVQCSIHEAIVRCIILGAQCSVHQIRVLVMKTGFAHCWLSLLSSPGSRRLYRMESLHPPRRGMTTSVLRDWIQGAFCASVSAFAWVGMIM